jgi:hypothetical protein
VRHLYVQLFQPYRPRREAGEKNLGAEWGIERQRAQDTNTWSLMKESGARGAGCPVATAGVTAPSPV